jgi:hypothetical protein
MLRGIKKGPSFPKEERPIVASRLVTSLPSSLAGNNNNGGNNDDRDACTACHDEPDC